MSFVLKSNLIFATKVEAELAVTELGALADGRHRLRVPAQVRPYHDDNFHVALVVRFDGSRDGNEIEAAIDLHGGEKLKQDEGLISDRV